MQKMARLDDLRQGVEALYAQKLATREDWAKIGRDLYSKISFDDIREQARPDYEMIKELFSRHAKANNPKPSLL